MKRKTSWDTFTLRCRPALGGVRSFALFRCRRCALSTEAAKTPVFKSYDLPLRLGLRQDFQALVDLLILYRNRRNNAGFNAFKNSSSELFLEQGYTIRFLANGSSTQFGDDPGPN